MNAPVNPNTIVWNPIPGSSQELALDSRAQHTLYTGARGPGKTDTQLMRFRKRVGQGYGPFWRGVILDREYKNLDDLVLKSKRWFNAFGDGARFLAAGKDYKWTWPTGEELLFRAAKDPEDYWDFHGQEFPFIGFNELAKYPTGDLYEMMKSVNRSSYTPQRYGWIGGYQAGNMPLPTGPNGEIPPDIPLEFFSTANPWGAGHAWVKRMFIDPAEYGELYTRVVEGVFNPQTQQREDVKITQVAIYGSYRENIYLDPVYVAQLEQIKDKNKRKAWLAGDWNIVAGGAIDDLWDETIHIIPRFKVPKNWKVDRALDWGSSTPFSVGWFAESNGEEVEALNGTKLWFPRGTIIQIAEFYGAEGGIGSNKGLRMSAANLGRKVLEYEAKMLENGWISKQPIAGPADNQIDNNIDEGEETIKVKMEEVGCYWKRSNKNKGSRENGLQLLRDRLEASVNREGMGFYITDNCKVTKALLPTLPRDSDNPDDIDTEAEDHIWDMIRFRLLAGTRTLADEVDFEMAS